MVPVLLFKNWDRKGDDLQCNTFKVVLVHRHQCEIWRAGSTEICREWLAAFKSRGRATAIWQFPDREIRF